MRLTPQEVMDTVRKWQDDWEQGRGPCPMVCPITFEPETFRLRTATLNSNPGSWEIELTYDGSGRRGSCFLSISEMDSRRPIKKITDSEICFESDGEPGRIFLKKAHRNQS